MASPLGHTLLGVAATAAVSRATETPWTPTLWVGGAVAALLPDLDLGLTWFGLRGPRYHRNASHSILVLAGVAALAWVLLPVSPGHRLAWAVALLTHPLLDVVLTGPRTASLGYGIALGWPISRRRWFVPRPPFETVDLGGCRSWGDVWRGVRPEIMWLGPLAGIVLLGAGLV